MEWPGGDDPRIAEIKFHDLSPQIQHLEIIAVLHVSHKLFNYQTFRYVQFQIVMNLNLLLHILTFESSYLLFCVVAFDRIIL